MSYVVSHWQALVKDVPEGRLLPALKDGAPAGLVVGRKVKERWTRQRWRTKSGKPSLKTGERYLPEKAIRSLSASEYGATTRAKRKGMRRGRQFVRQPKRIARKVRRYRRNGAMAIPLIALALLIGSLVVH